MIFEYLPYIYCSSISLAIGFVCGFIGKKKIIAKHNRDRLKAENKWVRADAKILELEKQIKHD